MPGRTPCLPVTLTEGRILTWVSDDRVACTPTEVFGGLLIPTTVTVGAESPGSSFGHKGPAMANPPERHRQGAQEP